MNTWYKGPTFPPIMWGSIWWRILKCVLYDVQYNQTSDKRQLCRFWKLLPHVLPCSVCKVNCQEKVLKRLVQECDGDHEFCTHPFKVIVEFHQYVSEDTGKKSTASVSQMCVAWAQIQAGTMRFDKFDLALFAYYVANCEDITLGAEFLQILNSFLPEKMRADIRKPDRQHIAESFANNCEDPEATKQFLFKQIPLVYTTYKRQMKK